MNRGGGTYGTGNDDFDLEVIELEPADSPKARADGPTPTRLRGRRAPVVVATVVIAALVGSAMLSRSRASRRSATSTTRPGQAAIDLASTPLFPLRVGARILTAGSNGLQLFDTDTGRRTMLRIAGLPEGQVTIVAASAGTVAVRVSAYLYWFSMQERVARSFHGDVAFPAAQPGHLWFAGPRFATEVPGAPHPVATLGQAIGATNAGLVMVTKAGVMLQSTGDPSIDPRLLLPAPATVIGVHPDRVAWVSNDCGVLRCPVYVTEIAGGATSSWLQLAGRPNPLMVAGSSAVFSPDGNYLAIVVPDESVTSAQNLYVADLRSRATTVTFVRGRFDQPARPGSDDATGTTIDWTPDSRFLLLAPASGSGPIAVMDPVTARIVSSRAPIGVISSIAVTGTSTSGPRDLPRHGPTAAVDSGRPTSFATPGLTLIGADDHQVDAIDLTSGKASTWPLGRAAITDSTGAIARVAGGWLVVRSFGSVPSIRTVVELLRDGGGEAREVANGLQVFASNGGTRAWIVDDDYAHVRPYDPANETLGAPIAFSGQLAAIDGGLIAVSTSESQTATRLDLIDRLGNVHRSWGLINSAFIEILASGGTTLVFRDDRGIHAFDVATATDRLVTPLAVVSVSLSPNGENLAWVYDDFGPPMGGTARATRVRDISVQLLGDVADRVLIADDGTVLFTAGNELRRGRVDANSSSPVYGYAPDSEAKLALG